MDDKIWEQLTLIREEISHLRVDIATLKAKSNLYKALNSSIWGVIGGCIPVLIAYVLSLK